LICGVDEAGRGPLAGPVVAAAVILDLTQPIHGINDSKKLTAAKRNILFDAITKQAIAFGVGIIEHTVIDEINILNATKKAMSVAISNLKIKPTLILIDAVKLDHLAIVSRSIIKGDTLSASIAAASIIAKVTRDKIMTELDAQYPGYLFATHKGYPTKKHISILHDIGPCAIHRKSFSPVKHMLQKK